MPIWRILEGCNEEGVLGDRCASRVGDSRRFRHSTPGVSARRKRSAANAASRAVQGKCHPQALLWLTGLRTDVLFARLRYETFYEP